MVRLAANFGMSSFPDYVSAGTHPCAFLNPASRGSGSSTWTAARSPARGIFAFVRSSHFQLAGQVQSFLELDDIVDLRAHGDVGHPLQDHLDDDRHLIFLHPFLRLREGMLKLVGAP